MELTSATSVAVVVEPESPAEPEPPLAPEDAAQPARPRTGREESASRMSDRRESAFVLVSNAGSFRLRKSVAEQGQRNGLK